MYPNKFFLTWRRFVDIKLTEHLFQFILLFLCLFENDRDGQIHRSWTFAFHIAHQLKSEFVCPSCFAIVSKAVIEKYLPQMRIPLKQELSSSRKSLTNDNKCFICGFRNMIHLHEHYTPQKKK